MTRGWWAAIQGGAFQVEGGGRTINPGGRLGPPDVARLVGEGGRQCLWEAQSLRCVQGRCGQCSDALHLPTTPQPRPWADTQQTPVIRERGFPNTPAQASLF